MRSPVFGIAALVVALSCLTACDRLPGRSASAERNETHYRAAMADYAAGRLDKAIEEFNKALLANPANASARFQLACLEQDKKQNYLSAICNYMEYLRFDSSGKKAGLCRERQTLCERQLAHVLAKRFNIASSATLAEDNAKLKDVLGKTEALRDELDKQVRKLQLDLAALRRENDRLRRMAKSVGEVADERQRPTVPAQISSKETVKDLLNNEGDGEAVVDRRKLSRELDQLAEEEREETSATPYAPSKSGVTLPLKSKQEAKKANPAAPQRPSSYVVQSGDTLTKIAIRFYGRRNAWIKIREANKGVISTDGRLRVGTRIILPQL